METGSSLDHLLVQIGQPPASPVYFPLRHHSPGCSFQLKRLIQQYQPDLVLIEGPVDANNLIPFLQDETTRPPVAIYTYFVDQANQEGLNGELTPRPDLPARFAAWYPFAAFSPELVALREIFKLGGTARFIDLPFKQLLEAERQAVQAARGKGKRARLERLKAGWDEWLLARSDYVEELCRRTRSRDYNELWDRLFEAGGEQITVRQFREQLTAWAYFSRAGYPVEVLEREGNTAREDFMASRITAALQERKFQRVLVVTGAFHTVALPGLVISRLAKKVRLPRLEVEKEAASLLTPYSYYRMDEISGYGSGITAPQYYGRVWEALNLGEERPAEMAGLSVLVEVARLAKEAGEQISTADTIAAFQLARNLAGFRARPGAQPLREDILDAIRTTYIKGEATYTGNQVLKLAARVLTGEITGEVSPAAGQAPLVTEFYATVKKGRLPLPEHQPKQISLDLYQNENHALKSRFLHRLNYLAVPFCAFVSGPDFVRGGNLHLITENWRLQWSPSVDAQLVELSSYGSTLVEAATARLQEDLARPGTGAGEGAYLLLEAARMGLYEAFSVLLPELKLKINTDSNFLSLVDAAFNCFLLYSYREALVTAGLESVLALAQPAFNRAVLLLPGLARSTIEPEALGGYTDRFRTLLQLLLSSESSGGALSRPLLVETARRAAREAESPGAPPNAPLFRGALFGLLYALRAVNEQEVVREFEGYARGNRAGGVPAGDFLDGLLRLSKGCLLGSPGVLLALNQLLGALSWEEFVKLLPVLRRAFTVYTPREIDLVAEKISLLSGGQISPAKLRALELPVGELARLGQLDREVGESLRRKGFNF